jgi:hypothetical protein
LSDADEADLHAHFSHTLESEPRDPARQQNALAAEEFDLGFQFDSGAAAKQDRRENAGFRTIEVAGEYGSGFK